MPTAQAPPSNILFCLVTGLSVSSAPACSLEGVELSFGSLEIPFQEEVSWEPLDAMQLT